MELNFKLSVHHTSLGGYSSPEELISAIEDIVESELESKLDTEVGVNIEHEETPIAFFSCIYEKGNKEVIIPIATQLRDKDDIAKYQEEFGYAPSKYTLSRIFNITEQQYFKYCRNRHPDDPMKSEMGKDMKYYRILNAKGNKLLTYIASRRTFKSDKAVIAYGNEMGKIPERTQCSVEFDVPKEDYFLWKYGVKYGSKNNHYIAHETYDDGRDPEYFAYMATKLNFNDLEQVKSHFIEMGKLSSQDIADGVTVEKCAFDKYKQAKKIVENRLSKLTQKRSESQQEEWEYVDDEEYEDGWG